MKRFMLKLGKVSTNVIMVGGMLYTLSAMVYGVLSPELQAQVINALKLNADAILPVGISAGVSSIGIYAFKTLGSTLNFKLKDSDLARKLWEQAREEEYKLSVKAVEQRDNIIIQKQNESIASNKKTQDMLNVIIAYNKANVDRNLASNLYPDELKARYKEVNTMLEALDIEVEPITVVYEETVVKEVVKEDDMSGRL